ncbi:MAG: molybdate ABC transporter substrate-binding protein [Spirochaetes bacterium]|nr:molybdate ABC transporter substrate-binding protein [Spirochaetota bacterium]
MIKQISMAILLALFIPCTGVFADDNIMIFCGAAFKNPLDKIIELFQEKHGTQISTVYSGMGTIYSQIVFSKRGDVFIVPSPDFMEKAKNNNIILPDSVKNFAYIVPVINVIKGNPKNIKGIGDLARIGVRIAIGNPRSVFIGMLGVELIEKNLDKKQIGIFRKNTVVYADSFSKLSTFLLLGQVDAIIGFHLLSEWFPEKIETIKLKPDELQRIGCGKAAVTTYSKNRITAEKFIGFMLSDKGQKIFRQYHYFSTKEDADAYVGKPKPVGGIYNIPHEWIN